MSAVDERAIRAAAALRLSRIRGSIPLAICFEEGLGGVDEAVANLSRPGLMVAPEDRIAIDLILVVLEPFVSSAPSEEGSTHER